MEMLRKINRTLLEIQTGIAFWTVVALLIGVVLPIPSWNLSRVDWMLGLGSAGVCVMISIAHMLRCLERGLDLDEKNATKVIYKGYIIRYSSLCVFLVVTAVTEVLNPVIVCLGYLLIMKVAVYSQPFTHKLYNKLFHETDPIPEPLEEELQAGK